MAVEISTPYQFSHVTHVGFDHTTGGFVGLPPEWERVLRGEATVESINVGNNRSISPPNPYRRQSAMSISRRNAAGGANRRKQSCLVTLLGKCFGQNMYDDSRPVGRTVDASRLEIAERPASTSSVPPPYDSVKTYDEVESRSLSSSRRVESPATQ